MRERPDLSEQAVPPSVAYGVIVRHPTIVIGIPCYNEEKHLERAIQSLVDQRWTHFAVLISDNDSSDRSAAIAQEAVDKDPRFHLVRQPTNVGSAANFNFTLESSDSPLFMWLGAHDYLDPTFLEKTVRPMLADPALAVSYTHAAWVDLDEHVYRVTTSQGLDRMPPVPLLRAAMLPRLVDDYCTEVYCVLRRAFIGLRFTLLWGCDVLILGDLAFRGPFHCTPEPLYLALREPDEVRPETRMKRLTGEDVDEDNVAFKLAYLDRLKTLGRGSPILGPTLFLARAMIEKRFTPTHMGIGARGLAVLGWIKAKVKLMRSG